MGVALSKVECNLTHQARQLVVKYDVEDVRLVKLVPVSTLLSLRVKVKEVGEGREWSSERLE